MSVEIPLEGVQKINKRIEMNTFGGRGGYVYCELAGQPDSRVRIIRTRTRKKQLQARVLGGTWQNVTKIWQE